MSPGVIAGVRATSGSTERRADTRRTSARGTRIRGGGADLGRPALAGRAIATRPSFPGLRRPTGVARYQGRRRIRPGGPAVPREAAGEPGRRDQDATAQSPNGHGASRRRGDRRRRSGKPSARGAGVRDAGLHQTRGVPGRDLLPGPRARSV
jgi:hypothetical protein